MPYTAGVASAILPLKLKHRCYKDPRGTFLNLYLEVTRWATIIKTLYSTNLLLSESIPEEKNESASFFQSSWDG